MQKFAVQYAYGPKKIGNDGPCALWMLVFRNMYWFRALTLNQGDRAAKPLAARMVTATPRPKSVRDTASEFMSKVLKDQDFIAIHWRYDKEDFGQHCKRQVKPGNKLACEFLTKHNFDGEAIAEKIGSFLNDKHAAGDKKFSVKRLYSAFKLNYFFMIIQPRIKIRVFMTLCF